LGIPPENGAAHCRGRVRGVSTVPPPPMGSERDGRTGVHADRRGFFGSAAAPRTDCGADCTDDLDSSQAARIRPSPVRACFGGSGFHRKSVSGPCPASTTTPERGSSASIQPPS